MPWSMSKGGSRRQATHPPSGSGTNSRAPTSSPGRGTEQLEKEFAEAVSGHAVIGTPDDVLAQLVDLVTPLPVNPLMGRPPWPTRAVDETIKTIERMGRDIVPALKDIEPIRHIPEESLVA